jgi:phosphoglycerate dehydrogenase-like enzyme
MRSIGAMPTFRVAITGDFLDENGESAYGDIGLGLLENVPHIRYHFIRELAPAPGEAGYFQRSWSLQVTSKHVENVDGLIVLRPWIKPEVFAGGRSSTLVVIGRAGAGYDKIDLRACTDHDVAVFNVPNVLDHTTASSALMFMLALSKKLMQQDRMSREGCYDSVSKAIGHELRGRTLGIIGLGASGQELVRLVAPFEMRVLAFSPHCDPRRAEALGVRLCSLEHLLRESDFVSIHARLTEEKRKLIGAAQLAIMKRSAYIVNVARGEIIDQAALVTALSTGSLAGAGLDVFEREPLPPDDPLTSLQNVILTPHLSPATIDIWQAVGRGTAGGMLAAARGEVPDHVVNREVLDRPGFRRKLARFARNG